MVKKAKLGVIGCGDLTTGDRFGHLKYIAELQQGGFLELSAVCDISENRAKFASERFHVPYYTDAEKMLSTDLDCVYIATPDYTHHSICKMAAEHGKHFIVEKPMAVSLPCCDIIINAAKKAGVYFEVAENYFRTPYERVMKMAVQQGVIGEVTRVYVIPSELPIQHIGATRDLVWLVSGRASLLDMGSHQMSQLRNFAGGNPSTVRGIVKKGKTGWFEWSAAWFEFDNGVFGFTEVGDGAAETPYRKILGSKGSIYSYGIFCGSSDMGGYMRILFPEEEFGKYTELPIIKQTRSVGDKWYLDTVTVDTEPKIVYHNPYPCVSGDWGIGVAEEIMSIANAAVNDVPPEYGIEGRRDIEMVLAMIESGVNDAPVRIPIRHLTVYEKMVHDAYEKRFGHNPLNV